MYVYNWDSGQVEVGFGEDKLLEFVLALKGHNFCCNTLKGIIWETNISHKNNLFTECNLLCLGIRKMSSSTKVLLIYQ